MFFEYIDTRVIQTRDWKYTKRFLASPDELYNLTRDPDERHNLAGDPGHQAMVKEMESQLNDFFDRYADPRYDIWHGGTAKATLFYGNRNDRFANHFPGWTQPFIEKLAPFRDTMD